MTAGSMSQATGPRFVVIVLICGRLVIKGVRSVVVSVNVVLGAVIVTVVVIGSGTEEKSSNGLCCLSRAGDEFIGGTKKGSQGIK